YKASVAGCWGSHGFAPVVERAALTVARNIGAAVEHDRLVFGLPDGLVRQHKRRADPSRAPDHCNPTSGPASVGGLPQPIDPAVLDGSGEAAICELLKPIDTAADEIGMSDKAALITIVPVLPRKPESATCANTVSAFPDYLEGASEPMRLDGFIFARQPDQAILSHLEIDGPFRLRRRRHPSLGGLLGTFAEFVGRPSFV